MGGVRIALVDDNEDDNEYTVILLRKAGFSGEVRIYESGEEALEAVASGACRVDLMLLDVNMPGMDGFEFARRLVELGPDARPPAVVMLTSSSDPTEQRRAAATGAISEMVTKPVTVAALVDLISRLVIPPAADRPRSSPVATRSPSSRHRVVR